MFESNRLNTPFVSKAKRLGQVRKGVFCTTSGSAGFTLVEMMLAVFLIGLTAALVVINIDKSNDNVARLEAERFTALVRHLQSESIIVGYPLGLKLDLTDNQYVFYALQSGWQPLNRDTVLRPRQIPEGVDMTLVVTQNKKSKSRTEDESEDDNKQSVSSSSKVSTESMLISDPAGLTTPFVATFSSGQKVFSITLDKQYKLVLSENGSEI